MPKSKETGQSVIPYISYLISCLIMHINNLIPPGWYFFNFANLLPFDSDIHFLKTCISIDIFLKGIFFCKPTL